MTKIILVPVTINDVTVEIEVEIEISLKYEYGEVADVDLTVESAYKI